MLWIKVSLLIYQTIVLFSSIVLTPLFIAPVSPIANQHRNQLQVSQIQLFPSLSFYFIVFVHESKNNVRRGNYAEEDREEEVEKKRRERNREVEREEVRDIDMRR